MIFRNSEKGYENFEKILQMLSISQNLRYMFEVYRISGRSTKAAESDTDLICSIRKKETIGFSEKNTTTALQFHLYLKRARERVVERVTCGLMGDFISAFPNGAALLIIWPEGPNNALIFI